MPCYTYICDNCGIVQEVVRRMSDAGDEWHCPCGKVMRRDYSADLPNVSGKDYGRPIISDSLAVSTHQIEEHKRLFPDIQVTPDGRPVFDNYKKHERYLEETGFVKHRSKNKRRGKTLK